jgi:hypothetical protein
MLTIPVWALATATNLGCRLGATYRRGGTGVGGAEVVSCRSTVPVKGWHRKVHVKETHVLGGVNG